MQTGDRLFPRRDWKIKISSSRPPFKKGTVTQLHDCHFHADKADVMGPQNVSVFSVLSQNVEVVSVTPTGLTITLILTHTFHLR